MGFRFVSPPRVIALGKIPTHPEFLQNRTTREPERSFDAWLEAGMGFAGHRFGAPWIDAFELGSPTAIVWQSSGSAKCKALVAGVLFPSHDSIGRHYPLAIVSSIPRSVVARAPYVLPLALRAFLERAHDLSADFADLSPDELAARLVELSAPTEHDVESAAMEYDAWCRSARVADAWTAILTDSPMALVMSVVARVRAATEALRGGDFPTGSAVLRLPLGHGGAATAALWLDVVRRACAGHEASQIAFWAIVDETLIVALGRSHPSTFAALWYRHAMNDIDLVVYAKSSFDTFSSMSSEFGVRFDASMTEFLASVSRS